jgi:hypothetical protein
MKGSSKCLAVKFPMLVLLVAAIPATATAFCFSYGRKSNHNARYSPYPGVMAPAGQVLPACNYSGIY